MSKKCQRCEKPDPEWIIDGEMMLCDACAAEEGFVDRYDHDDHDDHDDTWERDDFAED